MRSDLIRLTVVTDSAERASLAIFGFRLRTAALEAPWCRFVEKADDFATIPDGASVMAIWFDVEPLLDIRWFNERHKRRFNDDWGIHAARIDAWLAEREARELDLLARAGSTDEVVADRQPFTVPMAAAIPQTPPRTMWS
jgi:hypothetical protein